MSTRKSSNPLSAIPGFRASPSPRSSRTKTRSEPEREISSTTEMYEDEVERSEREEDARTLGIKPSTLKSLEDNGFAVSDVFVASEDGNEELSTPFMKLENSKGNSFYAEIDMEDMGISANTGTSIFERSDVASKITHDFKKKTLISSLKGSPITGSAVICDKGGVCFLKPDNEGEPTEAYFTRRTNYEEEMYDEKGKSIHPVVKLSSLLSDPKKVDDAVQTMSEDIRKEFSRSSIENIRKTKLSLKEFYDKINTIENIIAERFQDINRKIIILEDILSDYNTDPPRNDKEVYQKQITERELEIRKKQFEELRIYSEDILYKVYNYFEKISETTTNAIEVLNEEKLRSDYVNLEFLED